jgi:hypothetical protein
LKDQLGRCPVCNGELMVTEYTCKDCDTGIKGRFKRCDLCNLPEDLLHFVRIFLSCEGNIKEVEKELGLSYPTVKSRLNKIKQLLDIGRFSHYMETQNRLELLNNFKEGKIKIDDVLRNLE